MTTHEPTHLVVMGVSGTGKTSLALALAEQLNLTFAEGDDLHPKENIAKMSAGIPLNDEDRAPWLQLIARWMQETGATGQNTIVTCSALKRKYRDTLRCAGGRVLFLHLAGEKSLIAERMNARKNHFMPPALLDSQFETLEPLEADENGIVLDISGTQQEIMQDALAQLNSLR
ncbi:MULTISPECIES: gluconokinase [unclassified Rothia (in: high G+C Gram-positive bacteria)]|uniref:gluconokinase n=1 Tax=unclassified Rothia (in: high G+C Gram-positive bacteria) TaxID=2689056 RepID=UPI001956FAEE|nr:MULTISPECIES: gluconokinase [unclassified Rothia (in: high G+C Gram-positive bacteria)]MBM7051762.1 gluconokinase [Rothia sp. ZJ1223]QRZ61620.1 gluconokinase [Rothia sp. ZJ932]